MPPRRSSEPAADEHERLLANSLGHKSTVTDRIDGLVEVGWSISELADIVGVTDEAVRIWRRKNDIPRRRNRDILDDLRAVVLVLLQGNTSREEILQWFHSRPPGQTHAPRPIDLITSDPEAVAAAAVLELEKQYSAMARILCDALRPDHFDAPAASEDPVVSDRAATDERDTAAEPARRKRIQARQRARTLSN